MGGVSHPLIARTGEKETPSQVGMWEGEAALSPGEWMLWATFGSGDEAGAMVSNPVFETEPSSPGIRTALGSSEQVCSAVLYLTTALGQRQVLAPGCLPVRPKLIPLCPPPAPRPFFHNHLDSIGAAPSTRCFRGRPVGSSTTRTRSCRWAPFVLFLFFLGGGGSGKGGACG